jgi:four helix bundle suffix protein
MRFKARRCAAVEDVRAWVAEERARSKNTDAHGQAQTNTDGDLSVSVSEGPCQSMPSSALAANAALSLLNLACHLLDRQIDGLAAEFENSGGFTERLYRRRQEARRKR